MNEDDIVKSFFEGMKKADALLPVPPFDKPVKPKMTRVPYWYAAAVLAAIFIYSILLFRHPIDDKTKEIIPFSKAHSETRSLLFNDGIEQWESPTNGLLKEFK